MKKSKVIRLITGTSVIFVMLIVLASGAKAEGITFQDMGGR
jgi:hypothetical protein